MEKITLRDPHCHNEIFPGLRGRDAYRHDRFLVSCWGSIPKRFIRHSDGTLATERIAEIKEAGIDVIPVSGYGVAPYDPETVRLVLAECEKLGLMAQLSDERIALALNDEEHRRELLESVVDDYSAYPALLSYYVTDEPRCERFEAVADVCRILEELDPAHEVHVNILGNRAYEPYWGCKTYDEHLTRYMETVRPGIISYDNYHFKKGAPVTEPGERGVMFDGVLRKKIDLPGFLDNLEEVREYSERYGVPFMTVILVLEHVDFRDLSEGELRYEAFTSLCSGVKRLSYFTYWEPYGDRESTWEHIVMLDMRGSMIGRDGKRSAHYDQIRRINRDVHALGNILLPYKVTAVYHTGAEQDKKLTYWPGSAGNVSSLSSRRAMLGFFENGFVLIVNKDYEQSDDISLAVTEGKRAFIYDKTDGIWKPFTGKVKVEPGDGELIRII